MSKAHHRDLDAHTCRVIKSKLHTVENGSCLSCNCKFWIMFLSTIRRQNFESGGVPLVITGHLQNRSAQQEGTENFSRGFCASFSGAILLLSLYIMKVFAFYLLDIYIQCMFTGP